MMIESITLPDFLEGKIWEAEFTPIRRLEADQATYGYAEIECLRMIPCVVFDDGTVYTTDDWQSPFDVSDAESVAQARWIDPRSGQGLIFLGGVPRLPVG